MDKRDVLYIFIILSIIGIMIFITPINYVITTGESMEPTIESGEIVVYSQYLEPQVNDIIVFEGPITDRKIVHRAIERENGGFITKGDNNEDPDSSIVDENDFIGTVLFHVTVLKGILIFIIFIILLLFASEYNNIKKYLNN